MSSFYAHSYIVEFSPRGKTICGICSILRNIPQKVEEIGALLPDEKTFVDKKFATYPFMLKKELYGYWNKEIRPLTVTIGWEAFEHRIMLLENLRMNEGDAVQKTGVYRIPKAFITRFLEEYNNKVHEYYQHA